MMGRYDTNTTADELVNDFQSHINGKVVLTTGVTPSSLGATFVESIAKARPGLLILAGRNMEKIQQTADAIAAAEPTVKVKILKLDLGSFAAVRQSAETVRSWTDVPHIDVVVNSAGLMATDYALTTDGFESQFATNHLGHFLFTNLIMDKILASGSPRIINVTSDGHRLNPMRWHDYNFSNGQTYNKWHAYGQSKTANMLMIISLAEKLGAKHGVLAYSLHPGAIATTGLGSHIDWEVDYPALQAADKALGNPEGWSTEFAFKSPERGTATYVLAAFDPSLRDHNGAYLLDSRLGDPWKDTIKPWATNCIEAERLWRLSEILVGQEFKY